MSSKIRVLLVDDSAVVRQTLAAILCEDPAIEIMGAAANPFIAAEMIANEVPDVIVLDVEMPKMDGITFLKKLMSQHPLPVVMCSSLVEAGTETAFKAMEYGAVDIILKPKLGTRTFFEESKVRLIDTVKAAASVKLSKLTQKIQTSRLKVAPKLNADVILPPGRKDVHSLTTTEKVVAVGASTGGTEALREFLMAMPENAPGIVIVQHMPEKFTAAFAQRLNGLCRITVKEAEDNETLIPGKALIAPGNFHMLLKRSGARYYVEVREGPLVSRHRPSVDVLFRSTARYAGQNAVGVIMTGMGDDGAKGLLEMKMAGSITFGQDEESCVVYGMPKEAVKLNAVQRVLPLDALAGAVINACR